MVVVDPAEDDWSVVDVVVVEVDVVVDDVVVVLRLLVVVVVDGAAVVVVVCRPAVVVVVSPPAGMEEDVVVLEEVVVDDDVELVDDVEPCTDRLSWSGEFVGMGLAGTPAREVFIRSAKIMAGNDPPVTGRPCTRDMGWIGS